MKNGGPAYLERDGDVEYVAYDEWFDAAAAGTIPEYEFDIREEDDGTVMRRSALPLVEVL
ncbi:MAG: hypothetical protein H7831_17930 [Magnetococcus sp. WYHC-3]